MNIKIQKFPQIFNEIRLDFRSSNLIFIIMMIA